MSFIVAPFQRLNHFVQTFDGNHARDFLDQYPDYPVYATVLYLAAVFFLPAFLKRHNKTYELKWVVASWNLFLSVVSTFGAYYGIRCVLALVPVHGLYLSVCVNPEFEQAEHLMRFASNLHAKQSKEIRESYYGLLHDESIKSRMDEFFVGPTAFFMAFFAYLKTPELLDTIFLILQGKPVSFLHWYHHIATAIYCWHSAYVLITSGLLFATMNYFVHSIMYFYYFLVMMGLRSTIRPFAPVITILQVLQMFIGMGITVYTYLQYWLSPAQSSTLFYAFFETVFSAAHYVWVEAASVLAGRGWVQHDQVPAFVMANHFRGCESDTTNMRMGMMMYGSYCVLFAVLFKELYLDKRASKRSLVLARREAKAADDAAASTTSSSAPARASKSARNGTTHA